MDYCFLGKRDEETLPALVVKDRDARAMLSFLVQRKDNVTDYSAKKS